MRRTRSEHLWVASLAIACALTFWAARASAFCRSYTCQADSTCDYDEHGCPVGGVPTVWHRSCITFSVQEDGSPRWHVTADEAAQILEQAYGSWTDASCEDGTPSIQVFRLDPVSCNRAQVNLCDHNASIWMFHDDVWPYEDDDLTIALTWTHFNPDSGEILDTDVEVNTAQHAITTDPKGAGAQFVAIATHEIGHIFGLAHSPSINATMYANYRRTNDMSQLSIDDIQGICTLYPPDRAAGPCVPEPLNGFASDCGTERCDPEGCCSTAPGGNGESSGGALLVVGLGLLLGWRRRSGQRRSNLLACPTTNADVNASGAAGLEAFAAVPREAQDE